MVLLVALALSSLGACIGTETGNPPLTGEIAVNAHSSDPATAALRSSEGGITVDGVWLGLSEIHFVDVALCAEAPTGVANVGPLAIANHAAPEVARAELIYDEASYCSVRASLIRQEGELPAGAPAELVGNSFLVTGTNAGGTPFRVIVGPALPLDLAALGGELSLGAGEGYLFLGFDVATWFGDVDLDSAVVGTDGTITLSTSDNSALFARFEENLVPGFELYFDLDRDGEPDDPTPIARGVP
jgi:hypothetical protein